ncbi:MAG: hypothetical protein JNN15_18930 [Blastocatellia bacterium]|nr:hypothetical protein [Blastocatellia bacterium]
MKFHKSFNKLLLSTTLCSTVFFFSDFPVLAQDSEPSVAETADKDQKDIKQIKELHKKTYEMLQSTVSEFSSLRLAENRVRLQTTAANLLWSKDKEQARTLYIAAVEALGEVIKSREEDDSIEEVERWSISLANYQTLIQAVRVNDIKLALELFQITRDEYFAAANTVTQQSLDSLEFDLMREVAGDDPEKILEIAEKQLKKGISNDLISAIALLREKDEKAAAKLAKDVVKKLSPDTIFKNYGDLEVAKQLYELTFGSQSGQKPIPLDETTKRDLINVFVQSALNAASPNSPFFGGYSFQIFSTLKTMMDTITRYAPSQAAQLRQRIAEFDKMYGIFEKKQKEQEKLLSNGSVDTFLEAAKQNRADGDYLVSMAVQKAIQEKNFDRARQIINEKLNDPYSRKQYQQMIDQSAISDASEQGDLERARRIASGIDSKVDKIPILCQLAQQALSKNDTESALSILTEARNLIPGKPKNWNQMYFYLDIAAIYARVEPKEGLEMIDPVVEQINDLIAAMSSLDGFVPYSSRPEFVDGEVILENSGWALQLADKWIQALAGFAEKDFDKVKRLTDRLQRSELKLYAKMSIVQSIFNTIPPEANEQVSSNKSGN